MTDALGLRLKKLRAEVNLTQAQLAEATGLSVSAIKSYENGWREPNSKAMVALERYFNVSGEYLRGESEQVVKPVVSDTELLELVRDDLPGKMKKLADLLEDGQPAAVELAYHLVNELVHVLTMENPAQRNASLSILQDIVVAGVFFLDVCENTCRDSEAADRIEYAKGIVRPRFEQALDKSQLFLSK